MSGVRSPKIVLGAGNVGDRTIDSYARYDTPEEVNALLDTFYKRGGRAIDTARNYSIHAPGTSEPRLGVADAGARFSIDTKVGTTTTAVGNTFNDKSSVHASIDASLADLKLPDVVKIDVLYLHLPDGKTPFKETLEAVDEAYRQGKFRRFGLSNFSAEQVEEFLAISKRNGYIAPTVYQGHYNAVVRSAERDLLPVLRKHGIAFYVYSPAAGGFFHGKQQRARPGSRFDRSLYSGYFSKPTIQSAVDQAVEVAANHGISGHAAALRWNAYHSQLDYNKGDAIVIGASSPAQLSSNLDTVDDGPLPQEVAEAINGIYGQLRPEDDIPYNAS
ncbi:hypothetical protein VPNG_08701 [Cytospora leucostoma]|uniref:NADP-dependent oxidoreductase domain-containing protein n=1 Tax=Cytospora leucostoma TaxID=1230097 RepID=A0A423W2E2_9PEZI|nr:hypothetical protein VPNG_08701 [Cytospora leucostoma]